MADLLDKVITLGIGLEKKATEALGEIEKLGKEAIDEEEAKEGTESGAKKGERLGAKKEFENKLVDHGVKAISEFIALLNDCKDRAESGARDSGDKILSKLHMASKEEVEVALEMARVAREKIDELEKRVAALEKKKTPVKKKAAPKAAKSE